MTGSDLMREPILLTPGPLSTSLATKTAMLSDWGSWDGAFNALTAKVCRQLVAIAGAQASHVCVPLQGSGTFAVEAAVGTLVPRGGKLLVLVNGAYGKRMARIAGAIGRRVSVYEVADDARHELAEVAARLADDPAITHVGIIQCETSTGILNPVAAIARVVAQAGRRLIVDAMSAFGALPLDAREVLYDALIASSNKCLEGVPGMGFVIVRHEALIAAEGNSHSLALDLTDQHRYLRQTGQWRFTPPTHVVAAFASALDQYRDEGGQPARLARYAANCAVLCSGLEDLGLRRFLEADVQAPVIVTWHAPEHPDYDFKRFYEAVRARGFLLYPGKLTRVETFRVGCIGAIGQAEIRQAVAAIRAALLELGWLSELEAAHAARSFHEAA